MSPGEVSGLLLWDSTGSSGLTVLKWGGAQAGNPEYRTVITGEGEAGDRQGQDGFDS